MSHGCGYEEMPPPSKRPRSSTSWGSVELGLRYSALEEGREYIPGAEWPWKKRGRRRAPRRACARSGEADLVERRRGLVAGDVPAELRRRLVRLQDRGIEQLYTHQAEAIEHALAGRHVVVTTPTASGKTLCYNAPVLQRDPAGSVEPRAVSVSDQGAGAGSARRAAGAVRDAVAAQRGERDRRLHLRRRHAAGRAARDPRRARTSCSAIPTWCTRASCRTIRAGRSCSRTCATSSSTSCTPIAACSAATCATCCGGCGASAGTTDRIRRFICSSATIANPRELAERLTEQPFELVDESGAPRGEKFFVFVNPPVVNQQLGIRRSYLERDAADRRRSSSSATCS